MKISLALSTILVFLIFIKMTLVQANDNVKPVDDHEKAIKAVNEGEILPLDEILVKVNQTYAGRIISINLKDSEKVLFGWYMTSC